MYIYLQKFIIKQQQFSEFDKIERKDFVPNFDSSVKIVSNFDFQERVAYVKTVPPVEVMKNLKIKGEMLFFTVVGRLNPGLDWSSFPRRVSASIIFHAHMHTDPSPTHAQTNKKRKDLNKRKKNSSFPCLSKLGQAFRQSQFFILFPAFQVSFLPFFFPTFTQKTPSLPTFCSKIQIDHWLEERTEILGEYAIYSRTSGGHQYSDQYFFFTHFKLWNLTGSQIMD